MSEVVVGLTNLADNVTIYDDRLEFDSSVTSIFERQTGPQASAHFYANLNANATQVQLGAKANATIVAGVEAKVGGTLKPFGLHLADINVAPYKFEQQVFSGQITIGSK